MATYTCPSGHVVLLDDDVILPGAISIGSHGYAQVCGVVKGQAVLLHRWLLGLVSGDRLIADHINRNILDNRRENLRTVTPTESNLNRVVKQRDLPVGVYRNRQGRYQAEIRRHRVTRHVGTFDTPQEAATARAAALTT